MKYIWRKTTSPKTDSGGITKLEKNYSTRKVCNFLAIIGFSFVNLTFIYITLYPKSGNVNRIEYDTHFEKVPATDPMSVSRFVTTDSHVNRTARISTTVKPVINPAHPFRFTIANEDACTRDNANVFLVMLVKCRVAESFDRQQIRQTWGGVQDVLGRKIRTMFLLGQPDDPTEQKLVEDEDTKYHDLIQENFRDTYFNLTYKNLMGWKWLSTYCPNSSYGLSIDSDMALNTRNLVLRLETMPRTNFAEGNLQEGNKPIRDKRSRWHITKEQYSKPRYPPFLNGGCYSMSTDVAARVFETSARVPFFKLDDVYIGMVLDEMKFKAKRSELYQQYGEVEEKLKQGVAVGVDHVKSINQDYLNLWHKVVGSQLEKDKKRKTKDEK